MDSLKTQKCSFKPAAPAESLHGLSSNTEDGARLDVAADGFGISGAAGLNGHFSMYGFLIHTPPQTKDPRCKPVTGNMKTPRRERMTNESERLNMGLSLL